MQTSFSFPEEHNISIKSWSRKKKHVALCYPNVYQAGMANLAVHLIYDILNSHPDIVCERFFIQDFSHPFLSLETGKRLNDFDVIAVSFQFETDYPNFLRMLIHSNIKIRSNERKRKPIIIAGGPSVSANPIPLSPFIDIFLIGDLETQITEFLQIIRNVEKESLELENKKENTGWFIPGFTEKVVRNSVLNLDDVYYPIKQIIPNLPKKDRMIPAFGRAFLLEMTRGCKHYCSFCLIGHTQKPILLRSFNKLKNLVDEGIEVNNVSKVALIGSSLSDHNRLSDFLWFLVDRNLSFSLSSFRADGLTSEILDALVKVKQKTITFAPESGSDILKKNIKKGFDNETVINACELSVQKGIRNIKLYFILGLPDEQDEDLSSIVNLVEKIRKISPKPRIEVSINPFIPKPSTPFQLKPMISPTEYRRRFKIIKKSLNKVLQGRVSSLDPKWARIQALLSVGGKEVSKVLERAVNLDSTIGAWNKSIKESGINIQDFLETERSKDNIPWSFIQKSVK